MVIIYNFAYVKFREDGETAVVNIGEIKNFDKETHHEDKCYMVRWSAWSNADLTLANTLGKNKKGRPTTFFRSRSKRTKKDASSDEDMEVETDEYYKAQILLFGETREEINDRITNGKRVRIPKIMESSVEAESSDDDEGENEQEGLKRKLGDVGAAKKQNNSKVAEAKTAALRSILAQKMGKRKAEALRPSQPSTSTSQPSTSTSQSSTSTSQSSTSTSQSSTSTSRPSTSTSQSSTSTSRPSTSTSQPSTSTSQPSTSTRCKQCHSLKRQLENEKKEKEEMRSLNRQLQRDILDRLGPVLKAQSLMSTPSAPKPAKPRALFATPHLPSTPSSSSGTHQTAPPSFATTHLPSTSTSSSGTHQTAPPSNAQTTPQAREQPQMASFLDQTPSGGKYVAVEGQVSLGAGISIPEFKLDSIRNQIKNSLMVKNLAVAVWGSPTLKESSVTGVACNRYKDHVVRPALDSAKLQAVKDFFAYHLDQQPLSAEAKRKELSKFNGYVREKIADLRKYFKTE